MSDKKEEISGEIIEYPKVEGITSCTCYGLRITKNGEELVECFFDSKPKAETVCRLINIQKWIEEKRNKQVKIQDFPAMYHEEPMLSVEVIEFIEEMLHHIQEG